MIHQIILLFHMISKLMKMVSYIFMDMKIFFKTIALVFSQKDVEDHTTEGRIGAEIIEDDK